MSAKKEKITVESLLPLGIVKLSEMLVEFSNFDKNIEKRLEKALLSTTSTKKYATSIKKQITSLANGKKFYTYYQSSSYYDKIELIRNSIIADLAPNDPALAADLFRLFLQSAGKIIENVDDSSGHCQVPLSALGQDLADCYQRINKININEIAQMIFDLTIADEYSFANNLVKYFSSIIGVGGLNKLEVLVKNYLQENFSAPTEFKERSSESYEYKSKKSNVVDLLRDIADELNDVDKYIEACSIDESTERRTLDIIKRFLDSNRTIEALELINSSKFYGRIEEVADYKISALTQLDRIKEAQEIRHEMFSKFLGERYYVEFLDNEPDEKQFKQYQIQAIEITKKHQDVDSSMRFLMWLNEPVLVRELIFERQSQISGGNYQLLRSIAAFLIESGEFEAASILYRSMVLVVLEKAVSKYYLYAIGDYMKAKDCSDRFRGKFDVPNHKEFEMDLLQKHGKKTSFWNLVMEAENRIK